MVSATTSRINTNGRNATLSGNITGTGGLSKTGSGALALSGNNTFSGGLTVSDGAVNSTNFTQVGSGDITITGGALLNTSGPVETTNSRSISISGAESTLQTSNYLWLDRAASTTTDIDVTAGGALSVGTSFSLADFAGTTGTLLVDGTNSTASSGDDFYVGYRGDGTATIQNNGVLTVGRDLILGTFAGSASTFNLNSGGTLKVGGTDAIRAGAGTVNINMNGGTLRVTGSNLTTSAPITLSNLVASEINTNNLGATLGGQVSGTGLLLKSGGGTLTLTANNTYTGGTSVAAGTLQLGNGGSTGSVAGNINNGGTVSFNRSGDNTYSGIISGSGGVTLETGILRFAATQTYSGPTTIDGGFLVMPTHVDQGIAATSTVSIASGANLDISNRSQTISGLSGSGNIYSFGGNAGHLTVNTAGGRSDTFSGNIGSSFPNLSLTKTGPGTLTLSGSNDFTGSTTISNGILRLGSANALSSTSAVDLGFSGALDLNGNSVTLADLDGLGFIELGSGTLTTGDANNHTLGAIQGTGGRLTKIGSGNLTLASNTFYTGATTINAGKLVVNNTFRTSGYAIANGATAEVNVPSGVVIEASDSLAVTGSGNFVKSGAGALIFSASVFNVGMASGGLIDVQAGELVGGGNANNVWTNNLADLNVANGATFSGVEANVRVDALSGSGRVNTGLNGAGYSAMTIGVDNGSGTFSGVIADTPGHIGRIVKIGSGTQTLSGANTFSGGTIIEAGSIRGTEYDAINVSGDGLITLDGILNVSLSDGFEPGGYLAVQFIDAVTISGTFAEINLPTLEGYFWNQNSFYNDGFMYLNAVPEPSTLLLILGFTGLLASRRTRRP